MRLNRLTSTAIMTLSLLATPAMAQSDASVLAILGNVDAPVEVIEIVGMTCSACSEYHQSGGVFDRFRSAYVDKSITRWTIYNYSLSRPGLWMAMIALCGKDSDGLYRTKWLLENQSEILEDADVNAMVKRLYATADDLGISAEDATACLSDAANAEAMVAAQAQLLAEYGLTERKDEIGLPFFIVNGTPVWGVNGVIDYGKVNDIIYSEYERLSGQ